MGFVKAFSGALSGSLADQWKDFLTIPPHLPETAGFAPAQQSRANISRSSNTKGSRNIITNGSKILVPEGFALVTLENGAITGFVSEPGGYEWRSDSVNSQSFLAGNGLADGLFKQSWDRFKFGGIPGTSQLGFYVNLKELPNNRFGTQGAIYWDDAYLRTQAGAIAHGTYSLRITDPLLFIKSFLPADYYMGSGAIFDFAAMGNAAANQLFTEVVGSLAAAFAAYANEPGKHNRIANLQRDTLGFSQSLSQVVEDNFHWKCDRGLSIERAALISIQYDETTESLIHRIQQADALIGARGNSNLQASFAEGLKAAGSNPDGGALGMGFMGVGMQGVEGAHGAMQQPVGAAIGQADAASFNQPANSPASSSPQAGADDPYEHLTKLKDLLDKGVISPEEFQAAKVKVLGLS